MEAPKAVSFLVGVVVVAAAAVAVVIIARMNPTGPSDTPTGDLSPVPAFDRALIKYREAGQIETGFKRVHGVAVGMADQVYVAGDEGVRVFNAGGRRTGEMKTSAEPRCLAVDKDGTVFAACIDHVEVYGPDGSRRAAWESAGEKAIFRSVAVSENAVLVADAGNRAVLRYDKSGKLAGRIGRPDRTKNIEGFVLPSAHLDVVVGSDGLLRVSDPGRLRVEVYTLEGDPMQTWGRGSLRIDGFSGCCNPTDIALLPDGRVVTSEKGVPRVKVYTAAGQFQCVVAGPDSFPAGRCDEADCRTGYAMDVAADSRGRVLVLDPAVKQVRIFVPTEEPKP